MPYQHAIQEAIQSGVKILPYHIKLDPDEKSIELLGRLPFIPPTLAIKRDLVRKLENFGRDCTQKNKKIKK